MSFLISLLLSQEKKKKTDPEAAVVPVVPAIPVDTSPIESPFASRPASSRTTTTEAPQEDLEAAEPEDAGDEMDGDVEAPPEEVEAVADPDNDEMADDPPAEDDMGQDDMMDDDMD